MDDQQFREILDRFDLSWDGYRKVRKGVKKRLRRRMEAIGCRTAEAYLEVLDRNDQEKETCKLLLTVSVSRFFRDSGLWEWLEKHLLAGLVQQSPDAVKVWSAGCALGQEVYSFKIVWETIRARFGHMPDLILWATDINPDYLEKARTGVYPRSALKEVPANLLNLYFRPVKRNRYAVVDELKEGIVWEVRDLLAGPPSMGFALVFLRNNLLTYYRNETKIPTLKKVTGSLAGRGFLIIGQNEEMPEGFPGLVPLKQCPQILRKNPEAER